MMQLLRNWYTELSGREQGLIAVLALLVVTIIGFYGITRPFYNAINAAEETYGIAVERQARIESKLAALTEPDTSKTKSITSDFKTFVSQSAGEAGFAVGKIDRQSDGRVNMAVESAKSIAFFGWLARLEGRGVTAETLTVTTRDNNTVSANVTLRSREMVSSR